MKRYCQFLEQSAFLVTPFIGWKLEHWFRENQENSIPPKQAQPYLCKLILAHLMAFSYVFIVTEIY